MVCLFSFTPVMGICDRDIELFCSTLARVTECINASLSCAPDFEEAIQLLDGFQCVYVRNFVGIGAVRYMPSFLRGQELAPELISQIDQVNSQLAEKLKEVDPLFSCGQTTEGTICIKIGVVRSNHLPELSGHSF